MKAPLAALARGAALLACVALFDDHSAPAQETQPAGQTQPASPAQPEAAAPAAKVVAAFNPARSDEKAIAIVDQVMKSYGAQTWAGTRFLKFTWFIQRGDTRRNERTHTWDIQRQRSRLEGKTSDGKLLIATSDHTTKTGQASLDGQLLFEADAKKYTDLAHSTLINDSYWLIMQFKLKDPGIRLRYEGELAAGPITYDKVQVSFDDGTGLTSKDKYWIFVNRATKLIERWSYVLQGSGADVSPVAWDWQELTDIGGMKFPLRKTQAEGETSIVMENVQVLTEVPDVVFTGASTVDPATIK